MKALEVTGTVDHQGHLLLDHPLDVNVSSQESHRVRVIVLFPEAIIASTQSTQDPENDPDDTPIEEIKASLKRAFLQAKAGQRIPIAQMWDGLDAE